MRVELGIAGVTVLLVLAGQGVLLALGLTRLSARTLLASSGLAYLAGVASTMLLGILLLALGGTFSLPIFTVLALLLAAGGTVLAIRRRRPADKPTAPGPRISRPQKAAIGLGCGLLIAVLIAGLADAGVRPLSEWDSWSIWTRKAVVLASTGFDTNVFAGIPYGFSHLDYPVLLPLFESVHFRAMGIADTQAIHAVLWILYVASLGSIAYLGSRFARVWVWLPVVIALAFASSIYGQLLTGYADVPLGLLAAPGVVCLGLWLRDVRDGDWRWLALAALLFGAAASVKNEGLLLAVAVFVAAAIVLVAGRDWRSLGRLGLGLLGVVVAIAPWRIWTAAHDIKSNLPIGKGLDPSYLSERSGRVGPTLKALLPMLESAGLSFVVPLALAIVVLGIATPGVRRLAAFYLLAGLGTLASVVWAFVITADTLDWQIATAGSRVIMGVAFVSVAALLHVGGLLDAYRERPADDEPDELVRTADEERVPAPA